MKSLTALLFLLCAGGASAESLCDAARADVERIAQSHGLQAEVRCRGLVGQPVPEHAELQGLGAPEGVALKSGPLAWPVRVIDGAHGYVQRVPLTVSWMAPAWVSTHDLAPGSQIQPSDLELQTRRWPDGQGIQVADAARPPQGRLRQTLRAGEILSSAALLPLDALQRGDRVSAVLTEGALEIRLPAQLLAPARVGERARVQASGRTAALEGRLIDGQTLKVDSE